ncbi:uncharacterized protein Dyak_GE28599, partial [Drosophila yakuba]
MVLAKPDDSSKKPKSPEKKDEKVLAKPDDSFKSVIQTDKPSPKEYSDDESDDEIDIPNPQDKPISQPTSLVTSLTGREDKAPLLTAEKAKSPENKDEKVLAKPDDSFKSVIQTVKPSPKEYSDDESDDEIDIPNPQDKPISQPTSLVTSVTGSGDKSPLHTEEKPKPPEKKDEKVLAKPDDSFKSVIQTDKPSPKEYSDDESDDEIDIPNPQDKPIKKPKPPEKKDEKVLAKPDDSFKSVIQTDKPSPKEYSDDESDDEIDIPNPQDKPISQPTSLVTSVTGREDKAPLHTAEKAKSPENKDEKVLAKPDDSFKSVIQTVKPSPKEYSDDESDDEIYIPNPQDKPISQPTSLVTSVTGSGDKSPLHTEEKPKSPEKKDEMVLAKPDDSSKSVFETVKPSPKEYSDDESDDEIDIPKPQDKPISQPTSLVTSVTGSGDKSPLHAEEKPKSPEKKDEKVLAKPDDSFKSVIETVKPSPKEYSDDESDDEIDIPNPQDKPISQPTSLVTSLTGREDKAPLLTAEKAKSPENKDEKVIAKPDDSFKSVIQTVKPSPKEYSDDESDDEIDIPNPQDKPISQPISLITSVIGSEDKSPLHAEEKPKSPEKKDEKVLAKPDDSFKSVIETVKPSPKEYSDDESDDEIDIPKPQDKPISQPTSLVTSLTGREDKAPLHTAEKAKSPENKDEKVIAKPDDSFKSVIQTDKPSPKEYSDDESDDEIDIPNPQDKPISQPTSLVTSVTGSGDKSPLHTEEKPKSPEKKDEMVLAKPDDSFKSVIQTVKPSPKEYSDDESDDEIDIPNPQDKPISQPISLITSVIGSEDKSPLHAEEKPKSHEKKDEKVIAKPDDSFKSVIETVKPSPKEYSDDESDDEIDIPKPQDKPISQPTSLVTSLTGREDKAPLHNAEKAKSPENKVEKVIAKPDDSFKSVIQTVKPSPKEYSDGESDDEINIPKPKDKPISQPTSLVTSVTGSEDKSPLHAEEKPKSPEKKDEKVLAKPDDSFKSVIQTVKPSPKEYSDDESDDEIDIPKPQDKPISDPISLLTSVEIIGEKSPLHSEEKTKSPQKNDEKVLVKTEDSFKSVIESDKPSPKEYSDDESDDEIDIPKQQDKPISQPTSLVTSVTGREDKAPLHTEERAKSPEKKDEKVLAKPDDRFKSVIETVKPSPKEYSDDESDDKIDIPKPQDKPISQPTSLVTSVTGSGDKSPLHTEEKPKSPENKDEKVLAKPGDSSTSVFETVKSSPKEYSDDQSDDEIDIPKPQDKPISQPTSLVTSLTGREDKAPLHTAEKAKSPENKDEKVIAKPDDSFKSVIQTVKPSPKEYSDGESDDEINIPKPKDKPISQPTSLVTSVTGSEDKSPLHAEEKPKSPEKKDEKVLAKPDDSFKSVIQTVKPSPKEYSDDQSDDEIDIPNPQDKPISQPTSLVTSVTGSEDKSPLHAEEKPKSPEKKDEKVLAKPDDSFKSVIQTVKPSPKEYSDDESDDEIDIPKPHDKPI